MTTITITQTFTSKTRNGGGGGAPPLNTVAPVISGSSAIGSTLSSTTGTWTGTPTITYSYQWKRAGVDIVGETNSTYVLVVADYNVAITCVVTATNAFGSASATSNSITGTGVAPVNTVSPVISGTPTVGQTLSSTTGTWTGNPTPTYTYQWKRNGSNIASATSSTYTLVQDDATFAITCAVTGTNVAGAAEATSNSLTIFDADAQAYITAATITDTTQKNAVNQFTVDIKAASVWTKMKAIYPFLGGTATTHKWNLKDPQDTNAAFRLVFTGGWTHSSTGALPNGTNGYADTFLNANTALQQFSHHHAFYHNTDNSGTGLRSMGGAQSVSSSNFRTTIESSGVTLTYRDLGLTNTETPVTASSLKGFRASSRTANNNMFIVKADGTSTTSTTSTATNALPALNCYLAAHNASGAGANYAIMSIAFHSLGDGLSAAEGLSLRNAVVTYNTTLGRL
jgi:hypothetical protein